MTTLGPDLTEVRFFVSL